MNQDVEQALNVLNRHDMQSEYLFGVWKTISKDGLPSDSEIDQFSIECLFITYDDYINFGHRDTEGEKPIWHDRTGSSQHYPDEEIKRYLELSWMVRKEDGSYERKAY